MARYFVRRPPARCDAGYWADDAPMLPDLRVSEHVATDTGLIDRDGYPIMRAPNPIGFHWEGE